MFVQKMLSASQEIHFVRHHHTIVYANSRCCRSAFVPRVAQFIGKTLVKHWLNIEDALGQCCADELCQQGRRSLGPENSLILCSSAVASTAVAGKQCPADDARNAYVFLRHAQRFHTHVHARAHEGVRACASCVHPSIHFFDSARNTPRQMRTSTAFLSSSPSIVRRS